MMIKAILTKSLLIVLFFSLVACDYGRLSIDSLSIDSLSIDSLFTKNNDQRIEVVKQATIEITRSLTVAPDSARAFLQNGELIPLTQLDLYAVNCEVELNSVYESPQIIEPGVFNVLIISQQESPIVMHKMPLLAALDYAWLEGDAPVDIKRYYHFKLQAQDVHSKSEVRALICRGVQSEAYNARLPRMEEMKAAVGDYIKFNL